MRNEKCEMGNEKGRREMGEGDGRKKRKKKRLPAWNDHSGKSLLLLLKYFDQ